MGHAQVLVDLIIIYFLSLRLMMELLRLNIHRTARLPRNNKCIFFRFPVLHKSTGEMNLFTKPLQGEYFVCQLDILMRRNRERGLKRKDSD